MRIALLAYHFAPDPAIGAVRPVDYSAVARSQLFDCLESLASKPGLHEQAA